MQKFNTYKDINNAMKEEIKKIKIKYHDLLIELQNNCNHDSEEHCDDDDLDGWREPTYKVWWKCKICGKTWGG